LRSGDGRPLWTRNKGKKMDPKLTVLFVLIGTIIGLSKLDDEILGRMKNQLVRRSWRGIVPGRRKS
jgi:hypothetical protein